MPYLIFWDKIPVSYDFPQAPSLPALCSENRPPSSISQHVGCPGSLSLTEAKGSGASFPLQEDAAGKGAGLGVVAGALGGLAAQQPGETPSERWQPADPERGEDSTVSGGWELLSTKSSG